PARPDKFDSLADRLGRANRLEHEIESVNGILLGVSVYFVCRQCRCRAAGEGLAATLFGYVHGYYAASRGERQTGDRGLAYSPATEDQCGGPSRDLSDIAHGPDPGSYAAADERTNVVGQRIGHRDRSLFRNDNVFTEPANAQKRIDGLTVHIEGGVAGCQSVLAALRSGAQPRQLTNAGGAGSARRNPRQDDAITFRDTFDPVTDRFDKTRGLMPQHMLITARPIPVKYMEIRMAHAGRADPHAHLPGFGGPDRNGAHT